MCDLFRFLSLHSYVRHNTIQESFETHGTITFTRTKVELPQSSETRSVKQSSNEIEHKRGYGTSGDVPVVQRVTSSGVESVMNADVRAREIVRHAAVEYTQTVLEEISNHTLDALAINIKMTFLVRD